MNSVSKRLKEIEESKRHNKLFWIAIAFAVLLGCIHVGYHTYKGTYFSGASTTIEGFEKAK